MKGQGTIQNYHAIKQRKNTINQDNQTLFGLGFMEMISRQGYASSEESF